MSLKIKRCALCYWDVPSHRTHFQRFLSTFMLSQAQIQLSFLLCRKLTPLKATVSFSSGFLLFFTCTGITLYDECTLTPTAWSRDNPEGDSYTPPNLAQWIWMAVSVKVPLQRRETLLWGPQTRTVAGHCEQGHPAAWCLFSASADVMQDINVHHTT